MSYRYAELVAENVAKAPPLTDEQISRLTVLFSISAPSTEAELVAA